jgi:hypothetical protein
VVSSDIKDLNVSVNSGLNLSTRDLFSSFA